MTIEDQEGGTENDGYFGSIGDAVASHVHDIQDNAAAMIMWNELIHMKDGNMYRMVPSWEENDRDPHNMRGGEIEKLKQKLSTSLPKDVFEEIFQVEQDRREAAGEHETEDALDQEIIPYEEWEKFPGMWEKMELCKTPRDKAMYMGNTSQSFYDEFPEHHPNAARINSYLAILNRKWESGLDKDYAEWFVKEILYGEHVRQYVIDCFAWLAYAIARDNSEANVYVRKALKAIDQHWRIEYLNVTAKKSLVNPITRLLVKKEQEWNKLAKDGFNVYNNIKRFGQLLFTDFRNQMNGYHWARYRRVRDRHAPRVMLKGVDINRCSVNKLCTVLRINRNEAIEVWHTRPFSSLEHAFSMGYVNTLSFSNDEETDKVVMFIEKHAKIACEYKDLHRMNDVRKVLFAIQKKRKGNISSDQWSSMWRYYNILKTNLLDVINGRAK